MFEVRTRRILFALLSLGGCGGHSSASGTEDATTITGDGAATTVGATRGENTTVGATSSTGEASGNGTVAEDGGTADASPSGASETDSELTTGGDLPPDLRALFVGNSFISGYDVPGRFVGLFREVASELEVSAEAVTTGGYTLAQHADDAETDGTPLAHWLRTGSPETGQFDVVVLQEQSQLGGFPLPFDDRVASIEAAAKLAALATNRGATVVLYSTWAYMEGDENNALLGFGSFIGMQDSLDYGYRKLAMELKERGADVRVAPVGRAFRLAYDGVLKAGGEPAAEGSEFALLYAEDGRHASLRGAYLAACVVAGTIDDDDIEVRTLADEPELGTEVSRQLRDLCARTLEQPGSEIPDIRRVEPLFPGEDESVGQFGYNVALSSDAGRAMIFAPGSLDDVQQSIRIYARRASTWFPEGLLLDDSLQWRTASMAEGGAWVAIDAAGRSVLSYRLGENGDWVEAESLAGSANDCVHRGIAVAGDGKRVALGSARCGDEPLAHLLVRREAGRWVEEAALPVDNEWSNSLALDNAGMVLVVGHNVEGEATVFVRDDGRWSERARLRPSQVSSQPSSTVVAISGNGQRIAMARKTDRQVVIYGQVAAGWQQEGRWPSPKSYSDFGRALALNAEGNVLVVGHPDDVPVSPGASSGSVTVYERGEDGWRESHLLVPKHGQHFDDFGFSLAISDDGSSVLVGAPMRFGHDGSMSRKGNAYLFTGL